MLFAIKCVILQQNLNQMKKFFLILLCCYALCVAAQNPKREFRGAWIQCVNGQFTGMSTAAMQENLTWQLNELQKCGINAILFQVRPEADALYESPYEPWSRFLTGKQGQAPSPYWDPLAWMVEQCHKRGMELHAWINPYRAKTKTTTVLAQNHPYRLHPERFFEYDNQILFDPGLPENRAYICTIVADIVSRYDVDGLHIDDYFYPYPAAGQSIPDDATYRRYNNGLSLNDWRRWNVNCLVRDLYTTVHATKPWVKFGVSPFGIYRNESSSPNLGSKTKGLQNYDDLYADVLCWVNNGWVDYNIPQIYWQVGHPTADYETLALWWNQHASGRPLVIGQDVERTVKYSDTRNPAHHQMNQKLQLQRMLPGVVGSCMWYSRAVCDNPGNYATLLAKTYHSTPALQPLMPFIDKKAPGAPRKVKPVWTEDGYILFWSAPKYKTMMDKANQYVVYRFAPGEKVDISQSSHIVAITRDTYYRLPYQDGKTKYTYIVTALDRIQNESKVVKKKIAL
jgi:uncharacterized lipoprotein YddW (UPF0748 family)